MAKRKSISKSKRFEVFKRDRFSCQYCGRTPPDVVLEVDHIIAVCAGGDNEESNLITSCFDCNRGKSGTPLSEIPTPLKHQLQERKARQEQIQAYNEFLMQEREDLTRQVNYIGVYWFDKYYSKKGLYVFGKARAASITRLLRNLTQAEILNAIDITFGKFHISNGGNDERAWRYFCAICWNWIRGE